MNWSETEICSDAIGTHLPQWAVPLCKWIDSTVATVLEVLGRHLDLQWLSWLFWLFTPIVITFVLPVLILIFLYGCAIFVHIYRLRHRIQVAYHQDIWNGARTGIASFWDGHGALWHGHEIEGFERIPNEGPALIIYYHGTLPIDVYYLISKCILYKNRTLNCVIDNFVFNVPGWKTMCHLLCATPGTVESCVEMLKNGALVCISPGGVRESLFSSNNYETVWGDRTGFARIALMSGVPVIPMFSTNCREAFRPFPCGKALFRKIYEKTRLPLMPIYGGFPVKMITYLGKPMIFESNTSPQEVRDKIMDAVELLIRQHQRLPGSIFQGILDRFRRSDHTVKLK